jgi:VIT1/CCC1 family predicted Fe2+/Mn2+ transporter
MKKTFRVGFSFGLTSGVITTLGLMIGLNSSTNSKLVVIGGILTIAIADALSDSMGIHLAAESQNRHSAKEIWEATVSTFSYKFMFSSLFILPVLFFELSTAIPICILIGLYLIFASSLVIAREQKAVAWKVIGEHIFLTVFVIIIAHFVGLFIGQTCGCM